MSRVDAWLAEADKLIDLSQQHDHAERERDILARQIARLVVTDELDHARVLAERFADTEAMIADLESDRQATQRRMDDVLGDFEPPPYLPSAGPRVRHIAATDDGYEDGMG